MLIWLTAAVTLFRPLDFGNQPPRNALALGKELYSTENQKDRTLQDFRGILGRWFDGRVHQETDLAVWVSPEALGRWYGWLAAKEEWPPETLQSRWNQAQSKLKGKLTFIVRVAAFPREDPLEFGTFKDADPSVIGKLRFRLSYKPKRALHYDHKWVEKDGEFELQPDKSYAAVSDGTQEACIEKRSASDILDLPFYHLSSLAPMFFADQETDEPDDGVPIGDYYSATYLVTFNRPASLSLCREMKLEVMRKGKITSATYGLLEPPPEKKKKDPWGKRDAVSNGSD